MKPGAGDDPFADEDEESPPTDDAAAVDDADAELPSEGVATATGAEDPPAIMTADPDPDPASDDAESGGETDSDVGLGPEPDASASDIPYKFRRDSVKEGRKQMPIFLREPVEAGFDDLVRDLSAAFDERVYKTDVGEAAMVVAQRNPDLVAEVLEEWGYGLE